MLRKLCNLQASCNTHSRMHACFQEVSSNGSASPALSASIPTSCFWMSRLRVLDPASTLAIERLLIEAHHHGTKVILVTHDVGQARRLAHEIIFMHHGRVVEHQPALRFFQQPESIAGRAFIAGDLVL